MRYDAEHKADTYQRVLQQAVLAIRTRGPDSLGVADVMRRAGLTHGGFYAHFPSREALLAAATKEMFSAAQAVFHRRTAGLPARQSLRVYLEFYLSAAHRDARETGCPFPLLAGDLPRMCAEVRAHFATGLAHLSQAVADRLREIGHAEPESAASSALSEMIGALSLARAVRSGQQSDAILAHARAALAARLGLGDAS